MTGYLTEREIEILRMKRDKITFATIADHLNITRARAMQLHNQALDKLVVREIEAARRDTRPGDNLR